MYDNGFNNATTNQTLIFSQRFEDYMSTHIGWQYGISGTLILSFILRQVFNVRKKKEVNAIALDIFLQIDMMAAISSGLLFYILTFTDTETLVDIEKKDVLDWIVAVVFVFIWAKPAILFLVVPSISKMLITLIFMLQDVAAFMVIMIIYIIALTQIFSTLLQDIAPQFSTLFKSVITTFDTMIGVYEYGGTSNKWELIFTALMILNLFFIFILLLNFMIAILSTTYGVMLEQGQFKYKCALYGYCERYMIAFKDKRVGDLVLHAPPINALALLLVPLTFLSSKGSTGKFTENACDKFSKFLFWGENIIFVGFFVL